MRYGLDLLLEVFFDGLHVGFIKNMPSRAYEDVTSVLD
jgi:hypothetical protein